MGPHPPQGRGILPSMGGDQSKVRAGVVVGRGALASESALLDAVEARVDGRSTADALARPIRILVPSASLRQHLSAALVRRRPAWLGLEVQTLFRAAMQVVEREAPLQVADTLLPVLVRRAAASEPHLARDLEGLEEGEGPVVGVVRDLLDAGFEVHLEEGLEEAIEEAAGPTRVGERGRALLRVASRVASAMSDLGLCSRSDLFLRAREQLEQRGEEALPSDAVFVHGVADATGVTAEWLGALARVLGAQVWIPGADDPASTPGATRLAKAPGWDFTERLRMRLGEPDAPWPEAATEPPLLRLQRAAGAGAEVRGVAEQVQLALDRGVAPERIGIVARELGPYRLALSTHLRRLGIPFSGGRGFPTREARRLRGLHDYLVRGEDLSADSWLDAADTFGGQRLADLRLGLHGLGIGRLKDVATLDLEARLGQAKGLRLPSVRGARGADDEEELVGGEDGSPEASNARRSPGRLERRHVSRETLAWAVEAARETVGWWQGDRERSFAEHAAALEGLTRELLGWKEETPGRQTVATALASLREEIDPNFVMSHEEMVLLLGRALEGKGEASLGGAGAGIQVLGAMEARGRTFDELHLLGLNRDSFPRPVVDDPLLPDRLRRPLEALLPDLPIKQRGFQEERHLFAWLCSSAPRVTLSWQAVSDDGKERTRSPLVDRILLQRPELEVQEAPHPLVAESALRPAFEHLTRAGMRSDRAAYQQLLSVVLDPKEALARALVLDEFEAVGDRWMLPGPYSGFIGSDASRAKDLFVTRLENLSYCPWRHFLERHLGLEPMPDAFAALPDVSPSLLGNVVHDVLENIVAAKAPVGVRLEEALSQGAQDIPWPSEEQLQVHTLKAAQKAAEREGILLPAFPRFLARRARPFIDQIAELDEMGASEGFLPSVLGAELEAELTVAGATLRFRADRVDVTEKGLRFIDYKTGKPVSTAQKAVTRTGHLWAEIGQGKRLQIAAYAGFDGGAAEVEGAFLFARPELAPEHATVSVSASDADARDHFERAVTVGLDALAAGSVPPRLLNGKLNAENSACEHCEVAEACVRGDSGARRRYADWIAKSEGDAAIKSASALIALRKDAK